MSHKLKHVHEALKQLGPHLRIEQGPPLKKATATPELLSDENTAPHYHLPARVKLPGGRIEERVARDALGQEIRQGREFHYLDWNLPTDQRGWYVYQLETENPRQVVAEHDERGYPKRDKNNEIVMKADENDWREVGYFNSYEEALEVAHSLAKE